MNTAFPYQKISFEILEGMNPRTRDILVKRFGLEHGRPATLEAIGKDHKITRERVRQIVDDGVKTLRAQASKDKRANPGVGEVLSYMGDALRRFGGVKREDLLVEAVQGRDAHAHVVFLLHLGDKFLRHRETEDFHPFWAMKKEFVAHAPVVHRTAIRHFEERNTLAHEHEVKDAVLTHPDHSSLLPRTFFALLEASKHVVRTHDGRWGLRSWPQVNPKSVREKSYIVLKETGKPLHFLEITKAIQDLQKRLPHNPEKQILSQTVHNELIKDSRFVLVGRGMYALAEWGYRPGTVKDVLTAILQEAKTPLGRNEIFERILNQRQVKESTIALNLQDKRVFAKNSEGKYYLVTN